MKLPPFEILALLGLAGLGLIFLPRTLNFKNYDTKQSSIDKQTLGIADLPPPIKQVHTSIIYYPSDMPTPTMLLSPSQIPYIQQKETWPIYSNMWPQVSNVDQDMAAKSWGIYHLYTWPH